MAIILSTCVGTGFLSLFMATKYLTKKKYGDKLLDPRWQKRRLEVFESDNFTCQWCGNKDKTLHVHHFCYLSNPWDSEDGDLVTLCCDCHKIEHLSNLTPLEKELKNLLLVSAIIHQNDTNLLLQQANKIILKYKK